MKFKIVLAGLAGGLVMFLWGFVAHMVLPLGEAGLRMLPHQDKLLPALSAQVKEGGLYMFPWPESSPGNPMPVNGEAREKAAELYKTAPHGLLIFYPPGGTMLAPSQLGTELGTNVVTSLILAALLSQTLGVLAPFGKKVCFTVTIGLCAAIAVNVPQWNWYGYPTAFTLAEMLEHVVGFALVGVTIASILRPAKGSVAGA